jgi:hypothetical protein
VAFGRRAGRGRAGHGHTPRRGPLSVNSIEDRQPWNESQRDFRRHCANVSANGATKPQGGNHALVLGGWLWN